MFFPKLLLIRQRISKNWQWTVLVLIKEAILPKDLFDRQVKKGNLHKYKKWWLELKMYYVSVIASWMFASKSAKQATINGVNAIKGTIVRLEESWYTGYHIPIVCIRGAVKAIRTDSQLSNNRESRSLGRLGRQVCEPIGLSQMCHHTK